MRNHHTDKRYFIAALFVSIVVLSLATGCKANAKSAVVAQSTASVSSAAETPQPLSAKEKLQAAKTKNSDTVAWLTLAGTAFDDAVVQTTDNDYYLQRNEAKAEDVWGCYFADCLSNLNKREDLTGNTVIYGHSKEDENPNGKRFNKLFRYLDKDFVQQNQFITLTLPDGEAVFQIGAVFFTDTDFYYINPNPQAEGFAEFAKTVAEKNEFIFDDVSFSENDKLLTLSACAYRYDTKKTGEHRLVVMGKLLGKDELPKASNVTVNAAAQRPSK